VQVFDFRLGDDTITAGAGDFVNVSRAATFTAFTTRAQRRPG
jgi:hypothetical protein